MCRSVNLSGAVSVHASGGWRGQCLSLSSSHSSLTILLHGRGRGALRLSVIAVKAEPEDPFFVHIHPPSTNCLALQYCCGLSGSAFQNSPWEIWHRVKHSVEEKTAIVREAHRGFNPDLEWGFFRVEFFF